MQGFCRTAFAGQLAVLQKPCIQIYARFSLHISVFEKAES
jgi:hypothetical protein